MDAIRLLQLPDLVREEIVLKLPSIADVIILEHTNHELRDWLKERRIYKKWERKHFGKTDKWRMLLFQLLAVQQIRRLIFVYEVSTRIRVYAGAAGQYIIDFESVDYQNPKHKEIMITAVKRFASYTNQGFEDEIERDPNAEVHWHDVIEFQGVSVKMYYYMYDLLRLGFMYLDEFDMGEFEVESPRLVRCKLGDGQGPSPSLHQCTEFTQMCSNCKTQFCGKECESWLRHRCTK